MTPVNPSTLFTQISQEKKDDVIDEEEDDIDYDDLENGKDEILITLDAKVQMPVLSDHRYKDLLGSNFVLKLLELSAAGFDLNFEIL